MPCTAFHLTGCPHGEERLFGGFTSFSQLGDALEEPPASTRHPALLGRDRAAQSAFISFLPPFLSPTHTWVPSQSP